MYNLQSSLVLNVVVILLLAVVGPGLGELEVLEPEGEEVGGRQRGLARDYGGKALQG